ncbi:MAG: septal ring lytic transglycosylase RlpA family protein [Saprospiraceae bacterium]
MIKSHVISSIVFVCLLMCKKGISQEHGIASYYADFFNGRKMANGDRYDPNLYTCAHPTAPIGTIIKVVRKDNPEQSVIVTVSDRGPFVKGRIIDLSKQAAAELGILHIGIAEVVIAMIKRPTVSKDGYFALSDAKN